MGKRLIALVVTAMAVCALAPALAYAAEGSDPVTILVGDEGYPVDENGEQVTSGEGWLYGDDGYLELHGARAFVFTGADLKEKVFAYPGATVADGTFYAQVALLGGIIEGGTFYSPVDNASGVIRGGVFQEEVNQVEKGAVIEGGTFYHTVTNGSDGLDVRVGTIRGGTFESYVVNCGTIEGGDFPYSGDPLKNVAFKNKNPEDPFAGGIITGGTFGCEIWNFATIQDGTFGFKVDNCGVLRGGTYNCDVDNAPKFYNDEGMVIAGGVFTGKVHSSQATVSGGLFLGEVVSEDQSTIAGGQFQSSVASRSGSTIGNGTFEAAVDSGATEGAPCTVTGGLFKGTVANWPTSTIQGGYFLQPVDDQGGTVEGGRFLHTIALRTGVVNACRYPLVAELDGLVCTADAPLDGDDGGLFAGFEKGSNEYVRFTLSVSRDDVVLPASIVLARNNAGGPALVEGTDYTWDSATGALSVRKGAASSVLYLKAAASLPNNAGGNASVPKAAGAAQKLAATGDGLVGAPWALAGCAVAALALGALACKRSMRS